MQYWNPIGLSGSHPGLRNNGPLWILAVGCAPGTEFWCRYDRDVRRQRRFGAGEPQGQRDARIPAMVESCFSYFAFPWDLGTVHARVHHSHHRCRRLPDGLTEAGWAGCPEQSGLLPHLPGSHHVHSVPRGYRLCRRLTSEARLPICHAKQIRTSVGPDEFGKYSFRSRNLSSE